MTGGKNVILEMKPNRKIKAQAVSNKINLIDIVKVYEHTLVVQARIGWERRHVHVSNVYHHISELERDNMKISSPISFQYPVGSSARHVFAHPLP